MGSPTLETFKMPSVRDVLINNILILYVSIILETWAIARPALYPGIIPGSFLFTQMTHRGSREQAGTIPLFSWDNP